MPHVTGPVLTPAVAAAIRAGAPVVALTGLTFHDLRGVRYQQGIDTVALMQQVAIYNEEVTGPEATKDGVTGTTRSTGRPGPDRPFQGAA